MEEKNTPVDKPSKLPKWLTTVTPFSKGLAMILFIIFPLVSFYLGIQYNKNLSLDSSLTSADPNITILIPTRKPTPTIVLFKPPTFANSEKITNWKSYISNEFLYSIDYPPEFGINERNGRNTISIYKILPFAGNTDNFIYFSVITPTTKGIVYNSGDSTSILFNMTVGETKIMDEFTKMEYTRLPDKSIDGIMAKSYLSNNPWEFGKGTKEIRYYLNNRDNSYIIGAYFNGSYDDKISEEQFNQILSTFDFTQ